jgi:hypothetical protein
MSQPLVLPEVVASMLAAFAPCFTQPSFDTFCHYIGALMLGEGRRTGVAGARRLAPTTPSASRPGRCLVVAEGPPMATPPLQTYGKCFESVEFYCGTESKPEEADPRSAQPNASVAGI